MGIHGGSKTGVCTLGSGERGAKNAALPTVCRKLLKAPVLKMIGQTASTTDELSESGGQAVAIGGSVQAVN